MGRKYEPIGSCGWGGDLGFLGLVFCFEEGLLGFVVDDGRRIPSAIALRRGNFAGDEFGGVQVANFGYPLANVFAVGVEFLRLTGGVENAQGLRIHAARGTPLPATVVGRQIAIKQLLHEILFAPLPVNHQVFGEKAGDDHATAVVHPANFIQLAHRRIHDGVAGAPRTPGLKLVLIIHPGKVFELLAIWPVREFGKEVHDVLIKLAPGQLLLPGPHIAAGFVTAAVVVGGLGGSPYRADADRPKFQRGAELGGALHKGKVALLVVFGDGAIAVTKLLQLLLGGQFTGR